MRHYPIGARWYAISNGVVSDMILSKNPKGIRELFFDSPMRHATGNRYVVVQPRGKQKWWLFRRKDIETPILIDSGRERDPLIMRAVLGG